MVISICSIMLGIISIIYFIGYAVWAGINSSFLYIWAVLGVVLIAYGVGYHYIDRAGLVLWKRVAHGVGVAFLLCIVGGLCMVGKLVWEGNAAPDANADYMIVLGGHVYGERMSQNLWYRVDSAYQYLQGNPNTKAVLSGGKGQGESITEAEAMYRYLVKHGIAKDRLLREETSVNTDENIRNSIKLIGSKTKKVIIVSNDYHIYRAKRIARKQGCSNVEAIGSKTHAYTAPNAYVREVIAVIKYKLCGQI